MKFIIESVKNIVTNNYFLLLFIWVVLSSINANKAFHIDDSFHIEAAKNIIKNPLKPMSGLINWGDVPTPMYAHNQPPLLFYLLAGTISIFGTNELSLHTLIAVFVFLSLLFFQKIVFLLNQKHSNSLLLLFGFSPAFIINQNVMTDIPLLSVILISLYFLIKGSASQQWKHYILSAVFISLGLLIKYTILPLIIVVFIVIYLKKDYKKLIVVLIPFITLLLWSVWNYMEFKSIHLIDRPKGSFNIKNIWAFIANVGALATFIFSLIQGFFRNKNATRISLLGLALFLFSIVFFYYGNFSEKPFTIALNILFFVTGLVSILLVLLSIYKHNATNWIHYLQTKEFIVLLYFISLSAFIVLFAPFQAIRHTLLLLPLLLFLGYSLIQKSTFSIKLLSILSTLFLGLALGISDWKYADYYRKMSFAEVSNKHTIWTVGLWGWKYYANKNGMREYHSNQSNVQVGDYFIYPNNIPKQKIPDTISLELVDKQWQEASILTLISGNNFASLYNSYFDKPAWNFSKKPIDTVYIYKVSKSEKMTKKDTPLK